MAGYVYILKSQKGTFYVGSTSDLEKRLRQHQGGHTQTTRNRNIFELVFAQEFVDLPEARRIERKIKSWKRKDYIEKIVRDGYIKAAGRPLSFNG